jgi:hypothetical protein
MENEIILTEIEIELCKNFAEKTSKTQRENRSGGTLVRSVQQIFQDTLRGKTGEFITKKFLEQSPLNVEGISLDLETYPRGQWDSSDIIMNDLKISIKSSKHFSKWLLLESKDILRGDVYDYYIFVLINADGKSGTIKGFAKKDEIVEPNDQTLILDTGDLIPGTYTRLDAKNHARHMNDLHNLESDWAGLVASF